MKNKSILLILLTGVYALCASDAVAVKDTSTLANAMQNGKTSGQVRYYYMYEDEGRDYHNYFGSAIGGAFKI